MKRKEYESPQTLIAEVEAESCFCGSVFNPEDERDDGVTIEGQEIGNTGDYSNEGWDVTF